MYKILLLALSLPLLASTTDIEAQSLFTLFFAAFGAGILLTFTPCVLPMIPILSSVIAGQGESLTKTKAFGLSLAYVLGTAITYALMGALAGASGEQLQSYFQNVWSISAFSFIFVIMAFAMFGILNVMLRDWICIAATIMIGILEMGKKKLNLRPFIIDYIVPKNVI